MPWPAARESEGEGQGETSPEANHQQEKAPLNLAVEPLEDRVLAQMAYHGGPVLSAPQVSFIEAGSPAPIPGAVLVQQYAAIMQPFGVGTGAYPGSVSTAAPATNAAVQQLITSEIAAGQLPAPGADSLYMVFLPQMVSDTWASNDAGYHSAFQLAGQWVFYTVSVGGSIPASHEFAEACTDPLPGSGWFGAGLGDEVCDGTNWQWCSCQGWPVTQIAAPDGQALCGPGLTVDAALSALPAEAFWCSAYTLLDRLAPWWFAGPARAASETLAANPMELTPAGQSQVQFGEDWLWIALAA